MTSKITNFNLDESFIATIRPEIPALRDPEKIRELCVNEDASEDRAAYFTVAQRIGNRIVLQWFQGEKSDEQKSDEQYKANLEPEDPNQESSLDYWRWQGETTLTYMDYQGGLHGDTLKRVREIGAISGILFEQIEGAIFVGEITWEQSDTRERVVVELFL